MTLHCPGQDLNRMRPEDVSEVRCPCGELVEFFKDDRQRPCPSCGKVLANPSPTPTCAQWCKAADRCRGGEHA